MDMSTEWNNADIKTKRERKVVQSKPTAKSTAVTLIFTYNYKTYL